MRALLLVILLLLTGCTAQGGYSSSNVPTTNESGDTASVTYTSVLNANAYGAKGTYRMKGTHYYEKHDGELIAVNSPER